MSLKWLPNALTILRCVLAFVVGWAILEVTIGQFARSHALLVQDLTQSKHAELVAELSAHYTFWATTGAAVFVSAATLDFLDGWLARKLDAESRFGRILDPIADKLLVGIPLLIIGALSLAATPQGFLVAIPAFVIVIRDISITCLRLTGRKGTALHVSSLAKWKTTIEYFAVGYPLVWLAVQSQTYTSFDQSSAGSPYNIFWLALLYLAAALSLYTGWQYARAAFSKP